MKIISGDNIVTAKTKVTLSALLTLAAWMTVIICCKPLQAQSNVQPKLPDARQLQSFKKEIRELSDMLQLPGYCMAVVKNGQAVYMQAEGYANLERKTRMTIEHMFQIASVTKTFTGNLFMQYEQEHKASIDDYALNYRFIDTYFGWPYNIDPNSKVRHFLSHTAEDGPGNSFVYNGQKFNYIYGVFEKAGNYRRDQDAYSMEVEKKIFLPLQMTHSITGFPDNRHDTMFRHIATPYIYDTVAGKFKEDTVNYQWVKAFPATGIISTIGDLVKYAASYDRNQLITQDSYNKITTPVKLNNGSVSPYGIGWFTEEFCGKRIHWHYGHADAYAALFVRVPETGYTFIFLSNSNAPSEALRLGAGQLWQSPFVTTFFKYFISGGDKKALQEITTQNRTGRALFMYYAANMYGTYKSEFRRLLDSLSSFNPEIFKQYNPALIAMMTGANDPAFRAAVDQLARAYKNYGHIQPYVATDLARYYEKNNNAEEAFRFYRQLADAKGFENWPLSTEACRKSGRFLIKNGHTEEGRMYYWRAVNNMRTTFADDNAITAIIEEMNALTQNKKDPLTPAAR